MGVSLLCHSTDGHQRNQQQDLALRKASSLRANTNFLPTKRISSTKNMAASSLIIFMYCLCLYADCLIVPVSADEETFQPLCSRMCHSSKDSSDSFIPPYQCSCSQSCAVFGDCCYDSPYKVTSSPSQFQSVCLPVEGRGEFQAVLSCPPHIRSNPCIEQFGHMPPVTSRITNVTYGNALCANCNGDDEDLVKWNVKLRCSSEDDWRDFKQIVKNMHTFWPRYALGRTWRSCTFHAYNEDSRILNRLELRPCDIPEKVSRCSRTWRGADLVRKCRSYEDPVYVENTLYRNSHCAGCNYKDLSRADCIPRYVRDMLEEGNLDESYIRACMAVSPYTCLSKIGRGMRYDFSGIFNPEYMADISEKGCLPPKGKRCCEGETVDNLTGRCRKTRKG